MCGYDLVAFCGKDAAGAIELDETASGEEDTRSTHVFSFQYEVVGNRLIRRLNALKRVHDLQHAIVVGALTEACTLDAGGVVARDRQLVNEILELEVALVGTHQ